MDWFNNREFNFTEEGRKILRNKMLSKKNPMYKIWNTSSKEEKQKWIKKMVIASAKRPTQPEKIMMDIIEKFSLPYKYTGAGTFWITNINPDFVNINGQKTLIEVFGDYWHNRKDTKEFDMKKGIILKKWGWNRIIVWEDELLNSSPLDIVNKIKYEEVRNYAIRE